MNRATTTTPPRAPPQPQGSPAGVARRVSALFDAWCDVVAPCPWTATAGRRPTAAHPLMSPHS